LERSWTARFAGENAWSDGEISTDGVAVLRGCEELFIRRTTDIDYFAQRDVHTPAAELPNRTKDPVSRYRIADPRRC
jgi:hypothetical protein